MDFESWRRPPGSGSPADADTFKGPAHVDRVRQWRGRNPGDWRRSKPRAFSDLQGSPVSIARQEASPPPLQDPWFPCPPVLVGLATFQTGAALQEDIHFHLNRGLQPIPAGNEVDPRPLTN